MSNFAAAVTREAKVWSAAELDLSGAADIEEITDRLRDVAPEAEVSLLFVESDDAYLAILRLDEGEDLRVFGSDAVFAEARTASGSWFAADTLQSFAAARRSLTAASIGRVSPRSRHSTSPA